MWHVICVIIWLLLDFCLSNAMHVTGQIENNFSLNLSVCQQYSSPMIATTVFVRSSSDSPDLPRHCLLLRLSWKVSICQSLYNNIAQNCTRLSCFCRCLYKSYFVALASLSLQFVCDVKWPHLYGKTVGWIQIYVKFKPEVVVWSRRFLVRVRSEKLPK